MKIMDTAFIHPSHSLKFGGRWGICMDIIHSDELPIKVQFGASPVMYGFSYDEVLSLFDYSCCLPKGQLVQNIHTGEIGNILNTVANGFITLENKDQHVLAVQDWVPVGNCEECDALMVGKFSALCITCEYPMPKGDN